MKKLTIAVLALALTILSACGRETKPGNLYEGPDGYYQYADVPVHIQTPAPQPTPDPELIEPDPSGVSPELVAFLDSYEAFIDEYIEFYQSYDATNPAAMLGEMSNMMTRMADFEAKLAGYDETEMSEADALYYSQVCLRCSQKLMKAM